MSKKKSIWGTFRVLTITLLLVASSLGIYAQKQIRPDAVAIHLSCSISEGYGGVFIGGQPFHTSCSISERYSGIIIVDAAVAPAE